MDDAPANGALLSKGVHLGHQIVVNFALDLKSAELKLTIDDRLKAYPGLYESLLAEGDPALERAAVALGTSPRSLQRKLNAEGTTWQKLVGETRKRLADTLVREGELSLTEVAYRLGFADLSGFSKSFRKWFGVSATDFRSDARRRARTTR